MYLKGDKMNRKELIKHLKTLDDFQDKLTRAGEYCLNECRIIDYNTNCAKCSITKYIDSVDPNLKNPLLCWSCEYLNECQDSPIHVDNCLVRQCPRFKQYKE